MPLRNFKTSPAGAVLAGEMNKRGKKETIEVGRCNKGPCVWITADGVHQRFVTVRSWIRDNWKAGKIRRRTISGTAHDGSIRVKYLYCVADIERELEKTESGGEAIEGGC